MKTRFIPAMVALTAGLIRCIAAIIYPTELVPFLLTLSIVMFFFFVMGIVIEVLVEKNFKDLADDAPKDEENIELENIDEESLDGMTVTAKGNEEQTEGDMAFQDSLEMGQYNDSQYDNNEYEENNSEDSWEYDETENDYDDSSYIE